MRAHGLVLLVLCASLAGCLGGSDGNGDPMGEPDLSLAATWSVGDWWLYTFSTPEWEDDSARLVVAEVDAEDGTAYMLGISSHREARRHAVLNHNPFLGRITHDNLSAYENGVPSPVFSFPLTQGKQWAFTLFGEDWNTSVTSISSGIATMYAENSAGQSILYSYDGWSGFLSSVTWKDVDGTELLKMRLVGSGIDHSGEVWFIRGGDIFSQEWDHDAGAPDVEIQDSFFVSDHPSGDDWDEMIYWLDAEMGGGSSSATLTLRDHNSVTALARQWGPGASEQGQMGTIPYPSGEYTLTLTQTSNSYVRLIVAGGITFSWTL